MKNFAFIIAIIVLASLSSFSQSMTEQDIVKGIELFKTGNFNQARIKFLSIEKELVGTANDENLFLIRSLIISCSSAMGDQRSIADTYLNIMKMQNFTDFINSPYGMNIVSSALSAFNELNDSSNFDKAASTAIDLMESSSIDDSQKHQMLSALISGYGSKQQYSDVLSLWKNYGYLVKTVDASSFQNPDSRNSVIIEKSSVYIMVGLAYEEEMQYHEAINTFMKALNNTNSYTENNQSTIYQKIAECYNKLKDRKNAIYYQGKALENNSIVRDSTYHAQVLLIYATMLYESHDMKGAAEQFALARGLYPEGAVDTLAYCDAWLYHCYQSIGDLQNANSAGLRLEESLKSIKDKNSETYIIILSNYASYLWNKGQYQQSKLISREALGKAEGFYGSNSIELFTFLYKYSTKLLATGELDAAVEIIDKAIMLTNKNDRLADYLNGISLKSMILDKHGRLGDAVALSEGAVKYLDNIEDADVKINFLNALGTLYGEIGDYKKNLQYTIEYARYIKSLKGEESPDYAIACLNLSELYAVTGNLDLANGYIETAVSLMGKIYGKNSIKYYEALKKFASRKSDSCPQEALPLYMEALELSTCLFGKESREYADILISLGYLNTDINNTADYLNQIRDGLSIKERNGYDRDTYYLTELFMLASYSARYQLKEEAAEANIVLFNGLKKYLKDNFQHLTEWQRDELWRNINQHLLWIPLSAIDLNFPTLNKLAYNATLLRKGLLLTATNNIDRIITELGDEGLKALHVEIEQKKQELQASTVVEDRDSISNILVRLQREELNEVSKIGQIMDFVDEDWTDVVNSMEPSDIAIEFFAYPTHDCVSYGACITGKQYSCPLVIGLFNDKELLQFRDEDSEQKYDYDNVGLYNCIWKRFESLNLDNAEHVYFSPDNMLHTLAIEYLSDTLGRRANEKWNLVRVSSTREIVKTAKSSEYQNCTLFGNLDYSLPSLEGEGGSLGYKISNDNEKLLRYGERPLPQTKVEIENLNSLLTQQAISTSIYTNSEGTERVFKKLSGTNSNIIHLATHGFYWNDEVAERRKYVSFLKNKYHSNLSPEEKGLICSGLIFSGANNALASDNVAEVNNDGILTAKELSQMNLNETDLVVLSACETGLGQVTGEGVFGLQRGFKLAGVGTLLMSLWKVDDKATQMLMTEFYRNLLDGNSKILSLRKAQDYVRNQSGFNSPEYWAGFILLDALN